MAYRILRLNEVLKEEVGKTLLKDFELPSGVLATVTRVITASDLETARVFVSVFPESSSTLVLARLSAGVAFVQRKINQRLRLRPVPRLIFVEEKEVVSAGRIEKLIEQAREKPVEKIRKKR